MDEEEEEEDKCIRAIDPGAIEMVVSCRPSAAPIT